LVTEKYWQEGLGASTTRHGQICSRILAPFKWSFELKHGANIVVAMFVCNDKDVSKLDNVNTFHSCNWDIHLLNVVDALGTKNTMGPVDLADI